MCFLCVFFGSLEGSEEERLSEISRHANYPYFCVKMLFFESLGERLSTPSSQPPLPKKKVKVPVVFALASAINKKPQAKARVVEGAGI